MPQTINKDKKVCFFFYQKRQLFIELRYIKCNYIFSESTSVLVSAIKSVAALPERNVEQFASCLQASHVMDDAKLALVQALNAQESITNSDVRVFKVILHPFLQRTCLPCICAIEIVFLLQLYFI